MCVILGVVLLKKHRNRGKVHCIIPTQQKGVKFTKYATENNEILTDWPTNPTFDEESFYKEEKPVWQFWRSPRFFLIIPEGCKQALKGTFETFKAGWTLAETKKYVYKQVAKSRQKTQLISNTWAIVILLGIVCLGVLQLWSTGRLR